MGKIKFGTDGWRAIMCEDFIFHNVEMVTQCVADYILSEGKEKMGLVIGYDTRFFSDRFALRSAKVLNANGIRVYLTRQDTPTPVTAFSILDKGCAGALMFTASHNPPEYNGIKFIPENAAPALPQVTDKLENFLQETVRTGKVKTLTDEEFKEKKMTLFFDPEKPYLKHIRNIIDSREIKKAQMKVIYNPMFGTGRNYVPQVLSELTDFTAINSRIDPYFGGTMPEPKAELLQDLIEKVKETGAHLGLATDGDADRFGVIDSDGTFINPNQVLALLYLHLMKNRGMKGSVTRTVATTHLLDKIARHYGYDVIETPVGFKYIGNNLLRDDIIIGGEESGGLTISGHIPEKDGILALALITEIRAMEGKPLTQVLQEIYAQFGAVHSNRLDIHCTEEHKQNFFVRIKKNPPEKVGNFRVTKVNPIDGIKLYMEDGSWLLFRPSGTEPLVRIYMEAPSLERLETLSGEAGEIFAKEKVNV